MMIFIENSRSFFCASLARNMQNTLTSFANSKKIYMKSRLEISFKLVYDIQCGEFELLSACIGRIKQFNISVDDQQLRTLKAKKK